MKKKSLLLTAVATLGLTAATMAQNVPYYVPTNGLVGWWPFNGNANDESGNGNNGTVYGPTLAIDRFGNQSNAYSFDGSGNYIQTTAIHNQVFAYSVSLWIKTQFGGTIMTGKKNVNAPSWVMTDTVGITLDLLNETNSPDIGKIRYLADGNYFQKGKLSNMVVNDNNWHNIVGVWNGPNSSSPINSADFEVYIDGQLVISNNLNLNSDFSPLNGHMGVIFGKHTNWQSWSNYNGIIDDIGIWNRALTQQEITALYTAVNCGNNTTITPSTNTLNTGNTATFAASTSDPNPNHVWQSDFGQGYVTLNNYGNYSGANTGTLNIANVQLPNHTQPIRVITTSGNCIDTSNVAIISITDTCINIITDTTLITVTDTLVINTTITSLNPPNNSNTIKVFPNPTNDHITIDYGNFSLMNGYQLRIENSLGQQVFQTNITQQSDYLNLTTWSGNGLYFVHIIDPQGNTIDIKKIVLQ